MSNIAVHAKLRPSNHEVKCVHLKSENVILSGSGSLPLDVSLKQEHRTQAKEGRPAKQQTYKFDGVVSQEQSYAVIEPFVQASLKGFVSAPSTLAA